MKTTLKHIAFGTLVFLLFSQMNFKKNEIIGFYEISDFGYQSNLWIEKHNKFKVEYYGHATHGKKNGTWKVENATVILKYKKKFNKIPDTLRIKRLDNKIDSLGIYKKL